MILFFLKPIILIIFFVVAFLLFLGFLRMLFQVILGLGVYFIAFLLIILFFATIT